MAAESNGHSGQKKHERMDSNKELLQLESADYGAFLKSRYFFTDDDQSTSWFQPAKGAPSHESASRLEQISSSNVLDQARAFLPLLNEANVKLEAAIKERGCDDLNMELFAEDGSAHIKLDLALGVADLYTPEAVVKAERIVNGQMLDLNSLGCSTSSDTSDDENEHETESESPIDEAFVQDSTSIIRPKYKSQTLFPCFKDFSGPKHKRAKLASDLEEAS